MNWITQNWGTITAIAGALYTLFSVINGLVQNAEAKSVIGKIIDGLSFISRAQSPGSIKAPFTMSRRVDAPPSPPDASARALLPFLLAPALLLASCAHGKAIGIDMAKCAVGQVPGVVSNIIPDVKDILGGESPNWQQDLTNLGISAGLNTVTCSVAAIIDELTSKKAALDIMGRRRLERGRLWMAQHGAK